MGKFEIIPIPIIMDTHSQDDPLPEDDPKRETEIKAWAQLLLDHYLWKLEKEQKKKDEEEPVI